MLDRFLWLFFFIFMAQPVVLSHEYLYPVASVDAHHLLLIYQKQSVNSCTPHLSLWCWNINTKIASPMLLSWYMPTALTLLPNHTGFSFMHDGLPRIKLFHKRSPRTIELSRPVYDISSIKWLDNDRFYFAARQHATYGYGIYVADIYGELQPLISDDIHDCIYPQVCDFKLFYIHRTQNKKRHAICIAPYPVKCPYKFQELIAVEDGGAIGFLNMQDVSHGYFLSYRADQEHASMINFTWHMLKRDVSGAWTHYSLFSFHIPQDILFGDGNDRVYESIRPFLPQCISRSLISYIDYTPDHQPLLCVYNINEKSSVPKTQIPVVHSVLLGMIPHGQKLYYGSSTNFPSGDMALSSSIFEDENGVTFMDIPYAEL